MEKVDNFYVQQAIYVQEALGLVKKVEPVCTCERELFFSSVDFNYLIRTSF